jgi:FdhD protein
MTRVEVAAVKVPFEGPSEEQVWPLAVETPLNVFYGEKPFAVMLVTPSDLEDFVAGFTVTEGVALISEILAVEIVKVPNGILSRVTLSEAAKERTLRERSLSGRTGCGLCGVKTLADLPRAHHTEHTASSVDLFSVRRALTALESAQSLNQVTRSVHAAAWATADGTLEQVREDVGRHCALDKLVGARLRVGQAPGDGFLVLTSRCSYEMVEKAAIYGAQTIVSISAPTALALDRARENNITLIAIARGDSVTVFHGAERVHAS